MGTMVALKQILDLVGTLDDSAGDENARTRFRNHLSATASDVGQIRDFIQECLRGKGDQYCRALQDLVNITGKFLGFEVSYGRYAGVKGQIGHDGYWKSPSGFHVVVEVKTTDVYAIKSATLVGYVDQLISDGQIPNWDVAMGLFIVGRADPEIKQLQNAIIAERRIHQLRIISVDALLSLAETMSEYDVTHEDILALLRPSGPQVDPVVNLITRLVATQKAVCADLAEPPTDPLTADSNEDDGKTVLDKVGEVVHWLTPVKSEEDKDAEQVVRELVAKEKIYAFGDRTPGRKRIKPGDYICFYETGKGVVAHATVASRPKRRKHPKVSHPDQYPWVFSLKDPATYFDTPIVIDAAKRGQLDAFKERDQKKGWAWFVQATHALTEKDFQLLTHRE